MGRSALYVFFYLNFLGCITCKFESETPKKALNIAIDAPPRTGYGIVMKTAENFPTIPNMM